MFFRQEIIYTVPFAFISKAFKQYPDTLEELDEMIHDEKARIECQYQSNPQVH